MHALRTRHAAISNTIVTKQIEVLNFDIIEKGGERGRKKSDSEIQCYQNENPKT
jgi:hypothetical protein